MHRIIATGGPNPRLQYGVRRGQWGWKIGPMCAGGSHDVPRCAIGAVVEKCRPVLTKSPVVEEGLRKSEGAKRRKQDDWGEIKPFPLLLSPFSPCRAFAVLLGWISQIPIPNGRVHDRN